MQPKVFIFSAPSGSGKTTIVKHLLNQNDNLGFSISATTRSPRGGHEKDGRDYYFWNIADFRKSIDNQEFVEWEKVYSGRALGPCVGKARSGLGDRIGLGRAGLCLAGLGRAGLCLAGLCLALGLAGLVKAPEVDRIDDQRRKAAVAGHFRNNRPPERKEVSRHLDHQGDLAGVLVDVRVQRDQTGIFQLGHEGRGFAGLGIGAQREGHLVGVVPHSTQGADP